MAQAENTRLRKELAKAKETIAKLKRGQRVSEAEWARIHLNDSTNTHTHTHTRINLTVSQHKNAFLSVAGPIDSRL